MKAVSHQNYSTTIEKKCFFLNQIRIVLLLRCKWSHSQDVPKICKETAVNRRRKRKQRHQQGYDTIRSQTIEGESHSLVCISLCFFCEIVNPRRFYCDTATSMLASDVITSSQSIPATRRENKKLRLWTPTIYSSTLFQSMWNVSIDVNYGKEWNTSEKRTTFIRSGCVGSRFQIFDVLWTLTLRTISKHEEVQ